VEKFDFNYILKRGDRVKGNNSYANFSLRKILSWGYGSSFPVTASQAQDPKFKPQYHQKRRNELDIILSGFFWCIFKFFIYVFSIVLFSY
jgi:hypothetical protein